MNSVFDKYYKKYDLWYERNKFAYLSEIKAMKAVLPKKGKGLEIGVGTGRFASALGIKYGVEPSKNMAKIAKQRGIDVKQAFGEDIPFKKLSFDYVAIIITLCFVDNPRKVIEEAGRILTKSGRIAVGIVDKNSFLGKFYQKKKSVFYKKVKFFKTEEVAGLLKDSGFSHISYYQTIFSLPDKMTSVDKPKKGSDSGGFVVIAGRKI